MEGDLQQEWPTPARAKPIVFIGAGGIVRDAHLPAYQKGEMPVLGVTDLDAARAGTLADEFGIEHVYPNVAAAVAANGTDAIYDLAVPPHAITGILPHLPDEAAVLIQKPMGTDLAHARQIRDLCRERKLKSAINFQLRFSPMMLAVKDAIDRGLIGEVLEIEVHLNIFTPWHLFPFLIPMDRVEFSVHSIHYLDAIRAIVGNPKGVLARTMHDPRADQFAQTRSSVILDFGARLRGVMSINHNHQGGRKFQSAWIRFEGTVGAMMVKLGVLYDYPNGEADALWFCPNGGEWSEVPLIGSWFVDAFMGPMRNLQRFDAGEDTSLYTSTEDAFQTMALVEACYQAADAPAIPLDLD